MRSKAKAYAEIDAQLNKNNCRCQSRLSWIEGQCARLWSVGKRTNRYPTIISLHCIENVLSLEQPRDVIWIDRSRDEPVGGMRNAWSSSHCVIAVRHLVVRRRMIMALCVLNPIHEYGCLDIGPIIKFLTNWRSLVLDIMTPNFKKLTNRWWDYHSGMKNIWCVASEIRILAFRSRVQI